MTELLGPRAIGEALARRDGAVKVRGTATYAYETPVEHPAYAQIVQATIARGRVTGVDASAAAGLDGVLSVLTTRNAERLAGRFLGQLPPPPGSPPLYDFYRYPGMGQSTFRLMGSTTAADVAAAGFLTDSAPYVGPFVSSNGVFKRDPPQPDDMPYGWTFLNGAPPPVQPQ